MDVTIEALFEQAMTLPTEARARLADLTVESLDADVLGPHDELWLAEAQRRLDDIRSSRAHAIPGAEALQRIRDALR